MDDVLVALSQCQRMKSFAIRNPCPITTKGLTHLTKFQDLTELDLGYSHGNKMDTRLLLDFARFCLRLDTIQIPGQRGLVSKSRGIPSEAISERRCL